MAILELPHSKLHERVLYRSKAVFGHKRWWGTLVLLFRVFQEANWRLDYESTGFDICDVHERDDLLGAATRKSTAIPALTVELRCTRARTLVRMRR